MFTRHICQSNGLSDGSARVVPRYVRPLPGRGNQGPVQLIQGRTGLLCHHPQAPTWPDVSRPLRRLELLSVQPPALVRQMDGGSEVVCYHYHQHWGGHVTLYIINTLIELFCGCDSDLFSPTRCLICGRAGAAQCQGLICSNLLNAHQCFNLLLFTLIGFALLILTSSINLQHIFYLVLGYSVLNHDIVDCCVIFFVLESPKHSHFSSPCTRDFSSLSKDNVYLNNKLVSFFPPLLSFPIS